MSEAAAIIEPLSVADEIGPDRGRLRSAHMAREATIVKVNRARVALTKAEDLVREHQAVVDQVDAEVDAASQRGIRARCGFDPRRCPAAAAGGSRRCRPAPAAIRCSIADRYRRACAGPAPKRIGEGRVRAARSDVGSGSRRRRSAAEGRRAACGRDYRCRSHRSRSAASARRAQSLVGRLHRHRATAIDQARRPDIETNLNALPLNDGRVEYPQSRDPTTPELERWQAVVQQLLLDPGADLVD